MTQTDYQAYFYALRELILELYYAEMMGEGARIREAHRKLWIAIGKEPNG